MQAAAIKQMAVFPVLKSIYRSLMRSAAHIEGTLTILFIGRSGVRICPLLVICPLLSGPETIIVWTLKENWDGAEEAYAGGDYRQAA